MNPSGIAFWDSSALVPLCTRQQTSPQLEVLARLFSRTVWWGTSVEAHSAIARLKRMGDIDDEGAQLALVALNALKEAWIEILSKR